MEYSRSTTTLQAEEVIGDNGVFASSVRRTRPVSIGTTTSKFSDPCFNNAVLDALPSEIRGELNPFLKKVNLTKEEFLYQEEQRLDYIYFPVTSVVSEFKMLDDGRMVEISVTGKEGAVGLACLYSNSGRALSYVEVSQPGSAFRLDASTLERVVLCSEKLRKYLNPYIDSYIRQISQKAICNMYHSVKQRLCTWLLMLQDRSGSPRLPLTHEQIARTLGVYRPSITCVAQDLRDGNLISYSRGGISIRDRNRIEQAACSCYGELRNFAYAG